MITVYNNRSVGEDLVLSSCFSTAQTTAFLYTESSSPRSKGDTARLESRYVSAHYNCVMFKYHMYGSRMGRLNVYIKDGLSRRTLLWRLAGDQGNNWKDAQIPMEGISAYMVIIQQPLKTF